MFLTPLSSPLDKNKLNNLAFNAIEFLCDETETLNTNWYLTEEYIDLEKNVVAKQ